MASTINSDNGVVSGSVGLKYASDNSGVLALQTNGNTAVTITSANNVGIGTTSPGAPLTVYGTRYDTMRIGRSDAASFAIGIASPSTTDSLEFYGYQAGYDGYLFTGVSGDKLRLNTNGNVVLKGGTSAASGVGITFPSTQVASSDANCLDDYEEGNWTPSQGANLTVVGSFSSGGKYTKIGRMVYVSGYLTGSTSISFTSGGTICENLPFSAITSPQQPGSGIVGTTTVGNTTLAYGVAVYAANAQSATSAFHFNIAYQV